MLKRTAYFVMSMILITSILIGCESKTDKQLNQLYEQANGYLDSGDYENAITVFNQMLEIKDDPMIKQKLDNTMIEKMEQHLGQLNLEVIESLDKGKFEDAINILNQMLEIKDDPSIRERLEDIKHELQAVGIIQEFIEELKKIQAGIGNSRNADDIMKLIKPTEKLVNQIDEIEISRDSEISQYIKSLKSNPLYQLYKSDYVSGSSIQTGGYEDMITLSSKIFRVKMVVDGILEVELPSEYK